MPSSDWSSDVCSDRKSTRLNSSHTIISYAVFCLTKELSNQGHSLAYSTDGIRLPAQASPGVVFRELFEEPKGGISNFFFSLRRPPSFLPFPLHDAIPL